MIKYDVPEEFLVSLRHTLEDAIIMYNADAGYNKYKASLIKRDNAAAMLVLLNMILENRT